MEFQWYTACEHISPNPVDFQTRTDITYKGLQIVELGTDFCVSIFILPDVT